MLRLLITCIFFLLPFTVNAAIIHVPGDFTTIQEGIDNAVNGDTVLVAAGTYTGNGNRDLFFGNKNLVLLSEDGPTSTIIDCGGTSFESHVGIVINNGQDSSSVIDGFTIRNAFDTTWNAAAIVCDSATPTIRNSIITDNMCSGIYSSKIHSRRIRIENCQIIGNSLSGLVTNYSTSAYISNSIFINNGYSGAFIHTSASTPTEVYYSLFFRNGTYGLSVLQDLSWENIRISNNTFVENNVGLLIDTYSPKNRKESLPANRLQAVTEVNNNIAAFNTDKGISFYASPSGYGYDVLCNNAYGNPNGDFHMFPPDTFFYQGDSFGNISLDPLFCDSTIIDFHIDAQSPCAQTNNSCGTLIGAFDVNCGFCCENRGNVDNTIGASGPVDVSDLTYLIAYLFQGGSPPPCIEEGNVDRVTGPSGPIDVSDVTYLTSFLFQGGSPPPPC